MGYAIIDSEGGKLTVLTYGTSKIKHKELPDKLLALSSLLATLIEQYKPTVAGVEKLFFAKNKKTALEVAHARGVVLLTLLKYSLSLHEFTPAQVKIAVANYGSADKQMVAKMVMHILGLPSLTGDDNAADALAVAIATAGAATRPY